MLGNGKMRCFIVLVFGLNVGPLLLTFIKIKKVSIVRDTSASSKCTSCSWTLVKWGYAVAFLLLQTKLLTLMLWLSLCNIWPIYVQETETQQHDKFEMWVWKNKSCAKASVNVVFDQNADSVLKSVPSIKFKGVKVCVCVCTVEPNLQN